MAWANESLRRDMVYLFRPKEKLAILVAWGGEEQDFTLTFKLSPQHIDLTLITICIITPKSGTSHITWLAALLMPQILAEANQFTKK